MNLEPLTRGRLCTEVNDKPVILVLYDMMDDGRLHLVGY